MIKRAREIKANIPTASMADIAFLLIIFFMVTVKFDLDRSRVQMPKSENRNETLKGSAYIVIHCADERLAGSRDCPGYAFRFSDGDKNTIPVPDIETLENYVISTAAANPNKPFIIKADGETPYQYIDDMFDLLRRNGVEDIVLLTEQLTVADR